MGNFGWFFLIGLVSALTLGACTNADADGGNSNDVAQADDSGGSDRSAQVDDSSGSDHTAQVDDSGGSDHTAQVDETTTDPSSDRIADHTAVAAFESIPRLGVRYTAYKLDNLDPGATENPTRTTPFFSLDNIIYLERDLGIGRTTYTQTLEPRLFYLWVKGQNQEDIPLFDSSEPAFSYRELFEENRFNGADRMGDANQAAIAVTSRLIDPNTGIEKFRASIGQLYYFNNRNVTLDNTEPLDDNESDIAGEMEFALTRSWNGKADIIWNTRDSVTERANARIQFTPGFRKIANLSYRYIKGDQNQIDASVLWPLTPSWHVVGRFYYDIGDTQKLETLAGFEYDSRCWGIRFVTRDFIDDESRQNRIFLAQIVLKGLGSFGSNIESVLEDGILGWSERPMD